jgi:argininosuccinate lyase
LAHGWSFFRDLDRLINCYERLDCSSLGAGALGGSTLPLNPKIVKDYLGFKKLFENSLDAVADRDFVAETLFDISLIGIHLSKLGEEIILWTSSEFGFATLDDKFSTGSSMLPQKKNPDIAELARGKSGRLIGNLTGFLATLKSLPLAYNRDLQEDKEPMFDSIDQIKLALGAFCGMLNTIEFHEVTMQSAADSAYSVAIDLAEWLVQKGMPFRSAYNLVGTVVKDSIERHVALPELVLAHPDLGELAMEIFKPGTSVKRRISHGSTGIEPVKIQIKNYEKTLNEVRKSLLKL